MDIKVSNYVMDDIFAVVVVKWGQDYRVINGQVEVVGAFHADFRRH